MKLLMAAAVAAAMLTAAPTKAAQIWVGSADGHGHVIHIEGEIVQGDANRFATAVGQARVAPGDATVYLAGPGGNVWAVDAYVQARAQVISECVRLLHPRGSLCWQVGNHVQKG
jgi:membrane-bound ClpP family serine protease